MESGDIYPPPQTKVEGYIAFGMNPFSAHVHIVFCLNLSLEPVFGL